METEIIEDLLSLESWHKTTPPPSPHIPPPLIPENPPINDGKEPIDDPLHEQEKEEEEDTNSTEPAPKRTESPFPCEKKFNKKLVLWDGDITCLKVDAIVNSTNENISERSGVSAKIVSAGGPDLVSHIESTVHKIKTGETRVTKGFSLPARYIIHTVGPRYKLNYRVAAENALHNAYRNCLQECMEKKFRTVAFSMIHLTKRHYPVGSGAHVVGRTIRRFLEHHFDQFDLIILVLSESCLSEYETVMPLYFPRTREEQDAVLQYLPADIGTAESGETCVPQRQIRITEHMQPSEDAAKKPSLIPEKFDTQGFSTMSEDHDASKLLETRLKLSDASGIDSGLSTASSMSHRSAVRQNILRDVPKRTEWNFGNVSTRNDAVMDDPYEIAFSSDKRKYEEVNENSDDAILIDDLSIQKDPLTPPAVLSWSHERENKHGAVMQPIRTFSSREVAPLSILCLHVICPVVHKKIKRNPRTLSTYLRSVPYDVLSKIISHIGSQFHMSGELLYNFLSNTSSSALQISGSHHHSAKKLKSTVSQHSSRRKTETHVQRLDHDVVNSGDSPVTLNDSITAPKWTVLNLSAVGFRDINESDSTQIMCSLSTSVFSSLVYLNLQGIISCTDHLISIMCQACPNLKFLDISKCFRLCSKSVRMISNTYKNQLLGLNLQHIPLETGDVLEFLSSQCHQLRHLDFSHCGVADSSRGIQSLSAGCPNLRSVSIAGSSAPPDALHSLLSVASNLVRLDISRCTNVSHASLSELLSECSSMTHLDMHGLDEALTDDCLMSFAAESVMNDTMVGIDTLSAMGTLHKPIQDSEPRILGQPLHMSAPPTLPYTSPHEFQGNSEWTSRMFKSLGPEFQEYVAKPQPPRDVIVIDSSDSDSHVSQEPLPITTNSMVSTTTSKSESMLHNTKKAPINLNPSPLQNISPPQTYGQLTSLDETLLHDIMFPIDFSPTHSNTLHSLNLALCPEVTDDSILALCENDRLCRNLAVLNLDGCHCITDLAVTALSSHMTQLESLNLSWTQTTMYGVCQVAQSLHALRSIEVWGCGNVTTAEIQRRIPASFVPKIFGTTS